MQKRNNVQLNRIRDVKKTRTTYSLYKQVLNRFIKFFLLLKRDNFVATFEQFQQQQKVNHLQRKKIIIVHKLNWDGVQRREKKIKFS